MQEVHVSTILLAWVIYTFVRLYMVDKYHRWQIFRGGLPVLLLFMATIAERVGNYAVILYVLSFIVIVLMIFSYSDKQALIQRKLRIEDSREKIPVSAWKLIDVWIFGVVAIVAMIMY